MKTAKYRGLFVLAALCFAFVLAAFCVGFRSVKADSGSDYISGLSQDKIEFADDEIKLTMGENDTANFVRKLAVTEDGLTIVFKVTKEAEEFSIVLTADSADVNGNECEDGDFDTSIKNIAKFTADGDVFSVDYNGYGDSIARNEDGDTEITVSFCDNDIIGHRISLKAEGIEGDFELVGDAPYYTVKAVDKITANIAINMISVLDDGEAVLSLVSIAQSENEKFVQTFEREEGEFTKKAYPIVTISESCFSTGYNFLVGKEYTVSLSTFSFLGNISASSLIIVPQGGYEDDLTVVNKNMKIILRNSGEVCFNICDAEDNDIVYAQYTVYGVDEINDDEVAEAPKYNMDEDAVKSFIAAYEYKLIDHSATGGKIYVRLGSSEYLTLPSMKSMVSDNTTPYDDLKYTVYYKTPASDSTYTSGLKIPLATAGEYKFFVVFEDIAGNKMTVDQFYRTDVSDSNKIVYDGCEYSDYIFSFTVLDNAPITVTAAGTQSNGYLGVEYTASSFTIKASSYETKYALYYSETEDAEEDKWIEIPALSDVKDLYDEDYNENGFTYQDFVDMAYDGSLTFTPAKMGYYKIVCTVSSTSSSRVPVSAQSVITVNEKPEVVVVDDHWLQNNVWSVVFLSIGTASLIGIIVILCIKPKEETETETSDVKTRSKRNKK